MTQFPLAYQNLAADIVRKAHDDAMLRGGSLYTASKRGIDSMYAKIGVGDTRLSVYVGPAADPRTEDKADKIRATAARERNRRKDLRVLEQFGLLMSPTLTGRVIDALAYHGLFRAGAILIGTIAYQCYPLTLGAALPSTLLATDDADLAIANIFMEAETDLDLTAILRQADPSFDAIPGLNPADLPNRFRANSGYSVDLVTPTRSRHDPTPVPIDGLEASATSLQYLAWLIDDSIAGGLPFRSCVPVRIPRPERFCVHKLILSQKRGADAIKATKDLAQAKAIADVLMDTRPEALLDAVDDAVSQGQAGWAAPLKAGVVQTWSDGEWAEMEPFVHLQDI